MADKGEKIGIRLKQIIDEIASGSEFVTYRKILSIFLGRELERNESYSSFPEYSVLKMIITREGAIFDYKNGKDTKDGFKYKEGYAFYFKKVKEEKELKKKDGEEKKRFVTTGLQMLFDDNTISEPLIDFECINELSNLHLVKILYPFLGKTVISIKYNRGYRDIITIIIHPHLLKEYNSRWFLFGYIQDNHDNLMIRNVSIDRIVFEERRDICVRSDIQFKKAPDNYYKDYFKDIVGVSKIEGSKLELITLKTTNYKVHQLIRTKPIHHSQKEIKPFVFDQDENKIEEGEFTIEVVPNIELQTKILSYGSGIYVSGEGAFQKELRETVSNMGKNYLHAW